MSKPLQNINLYLPEFRKKKHWLDAEKMLLLTGAMAVLLVVASGYEYWLLVKLRMELADKEQQHDEIAAATEALIDQYGVQTEDPALLANILELEQGLQSKQTLLQFLEGRDLGNTAGFSEHLADLSRYHVQGLSLTRVTLTDGGRSVELAGQILRPELVTEFLQNLSKGNTYAGKNFEMLQIGDVTVAPRSGDDGTVEAQPIWEFQVRSQAQQ